MAQVPRHMDNTPIVPQYLPGDGSMLEERDESLSSLSSFTDVPLTEVSCENPKKPRLLLLQGELMDLTDNSLSASVLWQLVHWSQKVRDFELFVAEEKRNALLPYPSSSHGWFAKSDQELLEETMLSITIPTLHEIFDFLVDCGWVRTRVYLQNNGDRTTQYRVNLRRLCVDLHSQGYALPGFATYGI